MSQVAVIGLGRFGFHAAKALHEFGHEVLAIDIDREVVQRIRDFSSQAVVADCRDKDKLEALGIREFDVVVVSLGERIDTSSLVALHLRELKIRKVITKAGSEDHAKLLKLIGAHEIVFPEREAAEHLARRLTDVNVIDFLPLGESHSIHEVAAPEGFVGKTLHDLDLRRRYEVQVLAVRDVLRDEVHFNPGADWLVKESEILVILGSNEALARLRRI